MKKLFAFTLAVLMLSVLLIPTVQAIMVHDHGEDCALLGATGDCCSNPNRKDYISGHYRQSYSCFGTTYQRCLNCGYTISAPYYNLNSKCISTCYLPEWPY